MSNNINYNNTEIIGIEDKLKKWILNNLSEVTFDKFVEYCRKEVSEPAHTVAELSLKNNTKKIGDYFEAFTKLYFKHIKDYKNIWLLNELPEDIRLELSLEKKDYGIDLVGQDPDGKYIAIQCKYRKRNPQKKIQGISWKDLSTFYALVYRTGPYVRHIVVTNLDYVRHIGKKTGKDVSICYGRLKNLKFNDWFLMSEAKSQAEIQLSKLGDGKEKENNIGDDISGDISGDINQDNIDNNIKEIKVVLGPLEFIREKRLKFFEKLQ